MLVRLLVNSKLSLGVSDRVNVCLVCLYVVLGGTSDLSRMYPVPRTVAAGYEQPPGVCPLSNLAE